jgi:26S proteasome regulatory subunit N2
VLGRYRHVVGIAIEARNLDVLKAAIVRANHDRDKSAAAKQGDNAKEDDLMEYVLELCMSVVQERSLRNEVRSIGHFTF